MTQTTVAEQVKLLHVIWVAFLLAVAAYAPIPFLVVGDGGDTVPAPPAGVRSALLFAALGAAVSSFAAKRWWSNALLAAARAQTAAPVAAEASARLRAGCVITWALSEAVALIGFSLALVARRPAQGVPMAIAAVLLLYIHRPAAWPLAALTARGPA
jgi:F0F1-type ATP synthase membrane subunit c/vacuolar-type H+-ATPase subunit K